MAATKIRGKVKKVLLAVIEEILRNPLQFYMGDWVYVGYKKDYCDSTACIAGWTCAVVGPGKNKIINAINIYGGRSTTIWDEATKILHLVPNKRDILFMANDWPEPFRQQYFDVAHSVSLSDDNKRKLEAFVAVDRINHYIRTGE